MARLMASMGMAIGLFLIASLSMAGPPPGLCEQVFQPAGNERLLSCKYVGGDRATREIDGQKYLYDVGNCWDVDLVSLQKCGCRLFERSSICCRKGRANKGDCEWRVGNSRMIDCKPYKQPPFGLSGNTETDECRRQRMTTECWGRKDLMFGPGVSTGPCMSSPKFICKGGESDMNRFLNGECGPTPEDCGCALAEKCSDAEALKCYKDWIGNPAAVRCYDPKLYDNGYKRYKCMEGLK